MAPALELPDQILALDRQQQNEETRTVCPKDANHGGMLPTRDGSTFLCCICGVKIGAKLIEA